MLIFREKHLVSVNSFYDKSLNINSLQYFDTKAVSEGMFLPAQVQPRMAQVGEIFHSPGFSIIFAKDTHIFYSLSSFHIISQFSDSPSINHLLILGKRVKMEFFFTLLPWLT